MMCSSHVWEHRMPTCPTTGEVNRNHLSVKFLHCKVTILLFVIQYVEERCSGVLAVCSANIFHWLLLPKVVILYFRYFFYIYCHSIRESSLVSSINLTVLVWACVVFPYYQCFFDGQIVPDMASRTLLRLTPISIWHSHHLRVSLLSVKTGCSSFVLYFSCSSFGISHFSRYPWIFLVGNNILKTKIWTLTLFVATEVSLFLEPLLRQS